MLDSSEVESLPSGEMVAPVIQCLLLEQPGRFPLNVPNEGQVVDLPLGATVESMCVVSGGGVRGRDVVTLPPGMAESLRRVSAAQELTVRLGVTGKTHGARGDAAGDPLASRFRL
jgi:alpha-galactosidase